jgi:hypothetical protein
MLDEKKHLKAKALEIAVMMLGQPQKLDDHLEPTFETYCSLAEKIIKYINKEPELP